MSDWFTCSDEMDPFQSLFRDLLLKHYDVPRSGRIPLVVSPLSLDQDKLKAIGRLTWTDSQLALRSPSFLLLSSRHSLHKGILEAPHSLPTRQAFTSHEPLQYYNHQCFPADVRWDIESYGVETAQTAVSASQTAIEETFLR